jgi:hypothetical protein
MSSQQSLEATKLEEHYVLRVKDPELAERIRAALASEEEAAKAELDIIFEGAPRPPARRRAAAPRRATLAAHRPPPPLPAAAASDTEGRLRLDGREYPLHVLTLPTVVESYKTYDDVNLVKITDVGQVLVVGEQGASPAEAADGEAADGVAPPFARARARLFQRPIGAGPEVVKRVEQQMLAVLSGGAPFGYKFVDHEEVWDGVQRRWVPARPPAAAAAAAAAPAAPASALAAPAAPAAAPAAAPPP